MPDAPTRGRFGLVIHPRRGGKRAAAEAKIAELLAAGWVEVTDDPAYGPPTPGVRKFNRPTKGNAMDTETLTQPPVGTVVSDKGDELWKRAPHGWTYEVSPGVWDSGRGSGLAWPDLVKHYGPVKVVPDA